jgi:hypothetical protein
MMNYQHHTLAMGDTDLTNLTLGSELPELHTSRYQNSAGIIASGLLPVGFTQGHPRWRLSYKLAGNIKALAPEPWYLKEEDPEVFRRHYFRKLNELTLAGVKQALHGVTLGEPCVLLCFEDIQQPGIWCHRTLFASWWEQQTGNKVTEL